MFHPPTFAGCSGDLVQQPISHELASRDAYFLAVQASLGISPLKDITTVLAYSTCVLAAG